MSLPADVREPALAQVDRFCDEHVPRHLRSQVHLEHSVRGNAVTIVERRPPWSEVVGPEWTTTHIAQLRYDERDRRWSLYCRDSRERWWLYDEAEPATDVGPLLAAIDEDRTGIFWG